MQANVDELLAKAGLKKLNKSWAKLEILIGLCAAAVGLLASQWTLFKTSEPDWLWIGGGVALFIFGGYLAMAGHRSHLYQSNNYLTSILLQELQRVTKDNA